MRSHGRSGTGSGDGLRDEAELRRWATQVHRLIPGPGSRYLRDQQVVAALAALQVFGGTVVAHMRPVAADRPLQEALDRVQEAFAVLDRPATWLEQADLAEGAGRLAASVPRQVGEGLAVWAGRVAAAARAHARALTAPMLDGPAEPAPAAYATAEFLEAERHISKAFTALEVALRTVPVDRFPRKSRQHAMWAMDTVVQGRGEGGTVGEAARVGHLAETIDHLAQQLSGRPAAAAARLWRAADGHRKRLRAWAGSSDLSTRGDFPTSATAPGRPTRPAAPGRHQAAPARASDPQPTVQSPPSGPSR